MREMLQMTEEEKYWIWLSNVPGIGPAKFYELLGCFVDLKTAWNNIGQVKERLPRLNDTLAKKLKETANEAFLEELLEKIEKSGVSVLTRIGQSYPRLLAEIDNPPPVLYFKGSVQTLDDIACGIVGTRNPTKRGFKTAREMAAGLAFQGVTVVSGMARGIDTAAHLGTLDAHGSTVAVLGCGADMIYPPENAELYESILERGAVISEFFPGTQPKPMFFPQRNRIIAGLCKALVAGEGGQRSGARITVDYALQYGRDVYTLACDLNSPVANLPLYLVDSGAPLLKNAYELMEDQNWKVRVKVKSPKEQETQKLDHMQAQIYNLLLNESLSSEEIMLKLGCEMKQINTALTFMELEGLIEKIPGERFTVNI